MCRRSAWGILCSRRCTRRCTRRSCLMCSRRCINGLALKVFIHPYCIARKRRPNYCARFGKRPRMYDSKNPPPQFQKIKCVIIIYMLIIKYGILLYPFFLSSKDYIYIYIYADVCHSVEITQRRGDRYLYLICHPNIRHTYSTMRYTRKRTDT